MITTYQEPTDYDHRAIEEQDRLVARRPEPGQEGIHGLLEGHRLFIQPEGFDETRAPRRGRTSAA